MSSLNKAMIIGRLGQDPDIRHTQNNTAVANMSVATSEKFKDSGGEYQERTEWHKVVAWGRLAEICQQYLGKGAQVYFEGPIQTRAWENKEGVKQYTTEIKALQMVMLDNRKAGQDNSGGQQSGPGAQQQGQSNQPAVNTDTGEVDQDIDDDLPF